MPESSTPPNEPADTLRPSGAFGDLHYGSYLKVPELLQLQHRLAGEASHDELLFIIIHQSYELWFKLILFELDTVADRLEADDLVEARRLVQRVVAIEKALVDQIHLLETMTPRDFCHFRAALRPASGFQSVQFREVECLSGLKDASYLKYLVNQPEDADRLRARLEAPSLEDRFLHLLRRKGFAIAEDLENEENREHALRLLLPVYARPEAHADLYALCEALVEHAQWLGIWRFHHVRVVERIIGSKPGTGGSPGVAYLESTLRKRAFTLLWDVRALLDDDSLYGGGCPAGHHG